MKIPTPGRWVGLVVAYLLYNLGWVALLFGQLNAPDYRTILAVGFILQSVVMLVALCALFRPRFRDPPTGTGGKLVSLALAGLAGQAAPGAGEQAQCQVGSDAQGQMTIEIEEEQRQMIVLALAHLAVIRPGWKMALADTALTMDDGGMFKQFFEILRARFYRVGAG